MKTVETYKYEANARFADSILKKSGIESEVLETENGFELKTEEETNAVIEILKSLKLDESEIESEEMDYIEGYVEWTQKMYDPGHYTGGKIPHYLLDKSNWKFMIPIIAIGPILFTVGLFNGSDSGIETLFWMGLYAFVVFSMIWQMRKKSKERKEKKRTHNNLS